MACNIITSRTVTRAVASPMSRRRIILVEIYWARDKDPHVPLGHASLLAALYNRCDVDVVSIAQAVNFSDTTAESLAEEILGAARGAPADRVDVALGVHVWSDALVRGVLRRLRRAGFRGRVVLGGPQISYAGPGLERLYPEVDLFVRGYGEDALCAIADGRAPRAVHGVHVAGESDRCEHADVDLSLLPSPWLSGVVPLAQQAFVRWETQRGCPYRCAFCQHREPGARLYRRELHLERIEREIDLFCRSGVTDIAVLDPIFNCGRHSTAILERFLRNEYAGRLSLQCRAEKFDDAFLDIAEGLDVRLELGLQTIHDVEGRAIRRRNNLAKVEEALAAIQRRGIDHEVTVIYGLPEQTLDSFRETVAWCLSRGVKSLKAFPLMLLRGTALDLERGRWGLVESDETIPCVVASNTFDRVEWEEMRTIAEGLDERLSATTIEPAAADDWLRSRNSAQRSMLAEEAW